MNWMSVAHLSRLGEEVSKVLRNSGTSSKPRRPPVCLLTGASVRLQRA